VGADALTIEERILKVLTRYYHHEKEEEAEDNGSSGGGGSTSSNLRKTFRDLDGENRGDVDFHQW